mgnify:CR=1 FL=1
MNIKRTGWNIHDLGDFMDIVPQDDLKEHFLGDECWCTPEVDYVNGYAMFTHQAADDRELNEPDYEGKKKWQE